jgi:LacI family transcriptional regulator
MAPRSSGFKRVALIMGQDVGYCRGVLRGIQSFAEARQHWIFRDAAPSMEMIAALPEWEPDGIIAHLFDPEVARSLMRLRKPLVNVTSTLPLKLPLVEVDHLAVGRIAADHFLDSGFRNFGYFGSARAGFSVAREGAYRRRLAERGFSCSSHHAEYLPRRASANWQEPDVAIRRWLTSLPKPLAIFASNDAPARDLAEVCRFIGLHVPEQVALLGVDDDRLECGLAFPPLSSIAIPSERIGFEAAQMLNHLMGGERVEADQVMLPPKSVIVRQSSDIVAIADEHVSQALRFIRQNASKPIGVDDVLREVTVSRRKLERDFQRHIHRTIFAEIRRLRIEKAQRLLATTDLTIPAVAVKSGLESGRGLAVIFGRVVGMTPTAYRARYRLK